MASLHPQQARKLARVQLAHLAAQRAAEQATKERDDVLRQYRDRLPVGEWLEVAGFRIRRWVNSTGERYSLPYDDLTVEPIT